VLVGDCADLDVLVRVGEAKVYEFGEKMTAEDRQKGYKFMRLKFSAWMDYKTHRIVGYKIHSEAQNTDHVLLSLRSAISRFGSPQYLLTDNGKTYANKELGTNGKQRRKFGIDLLEQDKNQIEGILSAAGISTRFCLPFNSDGKPIERMFGIIHQEFDKLFFGQYAGTTKLRRPKSTDLTTSGKNHGNTVAFEEFEKLITDYIENVYNKRVFASGERAGMSPLHIWNTEYDAEKFNHYTDEQLALLISRETELRTVRRHEIRHSKYNISYFNYRLENGQKVYLRIDPANKDIAYCYGEDGAYICAATAKTIANAFATTPQEYETLSKAIAETNQNNKYHKEKISEIKAISKKQELAPEKLLKYQKNYSEYQAEKHNLNHEDKVIDKDYTLTRFGADLAEAARQEKEGTVLPAYALAVGQDFKEEERKRELRVI
jgi:hypothetical protein